MPLRLVIKPLLCGCFAFTFVLLVGELSYAPAADLPATSQDPEQSTPVPADVQERGINRAPFGGTVQVVPMNPSGPVGFSCDSKTHICSCRKSTVGDCDLMKSLVCAGGGLPGGDLTCTGSSQTCTCRALK
jgi:hypothetical protein